MTVIETHRDFRLNRLFSRPLSAALLHTAVTPNQITLTSLLFGILSGFCFSAGSYSGALAGAALYQTAIVLDNCDGEIARAKNMKSALGAWLDIIADFFTDLSLFIGIGMGTLKTAPGKPVLLFIALCLIGGIFHFTLVIVEKLKGFGPAVFHAPNPDSDKRRSFLFHLFDALREGESSWLVVLFAAIGRADLLLWFGGVYMQILWISALAMNFRWLLSGKNAR